MVIIVHPLKQIIDEKGDLKIIHDEEEERIENEYRKRASQILDRRYEFCKKTAHLFGGKNSEYCSFCYRPLNRTPFLEKLASSINLRHKYIHRGKGGCFNFPILVEEAQKQDEEAGRVYERAVNMISEKLKKRDKFNLIAKIFK